MAKPEKPRPYSLPVLEIESCIPSLEQNGNVYARLIKAKNIKDQSFSIRERSGIEIEQYIGKPLECVVEVVKARFFEPKDEENKAPAEAIKGFFVGNETGYKFFPELVSMVDGETGDADDDDFDEDEFDILANKLFAEWGIYGFGLDVYRDKPMIKTENGVFFLNEYIFEEWVDKWEESATIEKPVCFVIEELLLHGIKPYEGKWEKNAKKSSGFVPEEGASYIVGKPRFLEPNG
ncbi:hypothetical protein LJC72_07035 [Bacteroides sp. OttesenSCG-928-D19]|nr:hypothetical protein [Bacteroides sp. OttesenSCG-928-D19]